MLDALTGMTRLVSIKGGGIEMVIDNYLGEIIITLVISAAILMFAYCKWVRKPPKPKGEE